MAKEAFVLLIPLSVRVLMGPLFMYHKTGKKRGMLCFFVVVFSSFLPSGKQKVVWKRGSDLVLVWDEYLQDMAK